MRTTGVENAAAAEMTVAAGSMVDSAGRDAETAKATLAPVRARAAENNMVGRSEGSSIEVRGRAVRSEGRGTGDTKKAGRRSL